MMKAMRRQQRGLSMSFFLATVVVLIFVLICAMKLIPPYMQNAEIKDAFNTVAHDSEVQNGTVQDIRMAYIKRASVADITAIKPDEVEIGKDEKGISLSASYQVKIPLVANASLILDFNPSSQ
jgi:hypothetical protein